MARTQIEADAPLDDLIEQWDSAAGEWREFREGALLYPRQGS